jgi:Protein of unknown function (DUF2281)
MTTIDTSLIELIEELPSEARNEVRDFVEFLIAKQRRELARQAEANGWPPGVFENTAGSIPDFPDRNTDGIDDSLDEHVDALRLDTPEKAS